MVAARLKAAPRRAGERARPAGRGAGVVVCRGLRLARSLLDGGLAREREQSRGGLEFVDIGCRRLRDRTGEGPDPLGAGLLRVRRRRGGLRRGGGGRRSGRGRRDVSRCVRVRPGMRRSAQAQPRAASWSAARLRAGVRARPAAAWWSAPRPRARRSAARPSSAAPRPSARPARAARRSAGRRPPRPRPSTRRGGRVGREKLREGLGDPRGGGVAGGGRRGGLGDGGGGRWRAARGAQRPRDGSSGLDGGCEQLERLGGDEHRVEQRCGLFARRQRGLEEGCRALRRGRRLRGDGRDGDDGLRTGLGAAGATARVLRGGGRGRSRHRSPGAGAGSHRVDDRAGCHGHVDRRGRGRGRAAGVGVADTAGSTGVKATAGDTGAAAAAGASASDSGRARRWNVGCGAHVRRRLSGRGGRGRGIRPLRIDRSTPDDRGALGSSARRLPTHCGAAGPRGLRHRLHRRRRGAAGSARGRRLSHGGVERQSGVGLSGRAARGGARSKAVVRARTTSAVRAAKVTIG